MRRGNQGLRGGCSNKFGIWGVSLNCPNVSDAEHSEAADMDPQGESWVLFDPAARNNCTGRKFAFHARDWTNIFGNLAKKEVLPTVWTTGLPRIWNVYAAKIPTSYPGVHCEKYPKISSAADGGDNTWQADLGPILTVEEHQPPGSEAPLYVGVPKGYGYIHRSRACYVDGIQNTVVYSTQGNWPDSVPDDPTTHAQYANHFLLPNPPRPAQHMVGDTFVIPINDPSADRVKRYYTATMGGFVDTPSADPFDATVNELQMHAFNIGNGLLTNVMGGSNLEHYAFPCNNIYLGAKYMGFSSYNPTRLSVAHAWQVARIKYEGMRRNQSNVDVPGLECFATPSLTDAGSEGALGRDETVYDGDYVVCLFSQRCYTDSSKITTENFDEPYVIAIHKDFSSTKIVCSQWTSNVYRSGIGSADPFSGLSDGTITSSELALTGETIMNASSPPTEYSGETFPHPLIWAYSRMWDSVAKKNVNLALLTTKANTVTPEAVGVIADFEIADGGSFDPGYLDHGLPDGIHFKSVSDVGGNGWLADNSGVIGDDHAYSGDGGSYSAKTNINVLQESDTSLSVEINVTVEGDIAFKYRFDNRIAAGTRVPPFTELTDNPNINNTFSFWVDGKLVQSWNNDTFGGSDDTPYKAWYDFTYHLTAGTHTIRWTAHRGDAQDELIVQLDHITFPNIMVGPNIDGYIYWYYDGYKLRKLTDFVWAHRDEEGDGSGTNQTPIASRADTIPYYIAMDGSGRILLGNPHGVQRRLRDGSLDKDFGKSRGPGFADQHSGFVRFTATPNLQPPVPSCLDPDGRAATPDLIADPPWGAFQILPVGEEAFQVRGANASLDTDMTFDPIDRGLWTYKHPVTGKINHEIFENVAKVTDGQWQDRAHSWTISDHGRSLEPHVEVIWRPTMHQPAWPSEAAGPTDAERFPHPPYRSDFGASTMNNEYAPEGVRWRDPRRISEENSILFEGTLDEVISVIEFKLSGGPDDDNALIGAYIRIGNNVGSISSWNGTTKVVDVSTSFDDPVPIPGTSFTVFRYAPKWSMTNLIIPRTYSDAWSRRPQALWVRNTSDGPSSMSDPDYWDPDWTKAYVEEVRTASLTDDGFGHLFPTYRGFGGPFGSAMWVLVLGRFNPCGSRDITYVYNGTLDNMCAGHGPDDQDEHPTLVLSPIQRPDVGHGSFCDFDAIPCDCGCC